MTYPNSVLHLPLVERKLILTQLLADMREYYQLPDADLCTYIIPTPVVPDDLQVDLLIHALDLYQHQLSDADLLALIQPTLASHQSLLNDYLNGNTKSINSLIGKVIKAHPGTNPTQLKQVLISLQG